MANCTFICGNSFERVPFVYQKLTLSIILVVAISSDITNHCSDLHIAQKLDPIRTGANFLSVLVKRPGSTGSTSFLVKSLRDMRLCKK
jgi:hypothetical protein